MCIKKIKEKIKEWLGKDEPEEEIDPDEPRCKRRILSHDEIDDTHDPNVLYCRGMIVGWQRRERDALDEPDKQEKDYSGMVKAATNISNVVHNTIKYKTDMENYGKREYWATTDEILAKGCDDCDGQAMARWRMMRDAGFPDDNIGMVVVSGHMFACLHISDKDFYVLDNGYITYKTALASDIFPFETKDGKELQPIIGFNLFDMWTYTVR